MQKKLTLVLASSFFCLLSFAQIKKGTIVPHFDIGNLRYLSIENKNSLKNNQLSFNPGVGYFIKNNWEIGVGLNLFSHYYSDTIAGGHYLRTRTFGINIYTNYYVGKGKLKPYLTFQTGWDHITGSYSSPWVFNNMRDSYIYTAIGGGLNWNISSRFSIFTEATYRKESLFNPNGHSRLNLTIGARFFFNRKKM
jgi:hypothetical protein